MTEGELQVYQVYTSAKLLRRPVSSIVISTTFVRQLINLSLRMQTVNVHSAHTELADVILCTLTGITLGLIV